MRGGHHSAELPDHARTTRKLSAQNAAAPFRTPSRHEARRLHHHLEDAQIPSPPPSPQPKLSCTLSPHMTSHYQQHQQQHQLHHPPPVDVIITAHDTTDQFAEMPKRSRSVCVYPEMERSAHQMQHQQLRHPQQQLHHHHQQQQHQQQQQEAARPYRHSHYQLRHELRHELRHQALPNKNVSPRSSLVSVTSSQHHHHHHNQQQRAASSLHPPRHFEQPHQLRHPHRHQSLSSSSSSSAVASSVALPVTSPIASPIASPVASSNQLIRSSSVMCGGGDAVRRFDEKHRNRSWCNRSGDCAITVSAASHAKCASMMTSLAGVPDMPDVPDATDVPDVPDVSNNEQHADDETKTTKTAKLAAHLGTKLNLPIESSSRNAVREDSKSWECIVETAAAAADVNSSAIARRMTVNSSMGVVGGATFREGGVTNYTTDSSINTGRHGDNQEIRREDEPANLQTLVHATTPRESQAITSCKKQNWRQRFASFRDKCGKYMTSRRDSLCENTPDPVYDLLRCAAMEKGHTGKVCKCSCHTDPSQSSESHHRQHHHLNAAARSPATSLFAANSTSINLPKQQKH